MSAHDDPTIIREVAKMDAARAAIKARLLDMSATDRRCSDPGCPGPVYSTICGRGGCPMGFAGSCQAMR